MENSANALKIVFAIIMLILALSLTFLMISKAKETADTVFFVSDETNYYDIASISEKLKNKKEANRVVGADTVISTLYRLYDESLVITIDNKSEEKTFNSDDYKDSKEAYTEISSFCKGINGTYRETSQEIKTSGIYEYASDGSEITITPGSTRIYITYEKIS